jgi:putative ABC transport system substrate-binding protein
MAYGPTGPEQFRRAGVLAGKILTGSRPEDLPMEQSMKFELVINLKTAKQIGVTISPDVLYRADKMIK